MFNTDQGSQFTSWEFTQVLQERGVEISTDWKGRCQDNIFVERLWRTVKCEEVYLKAYASVLEAQRGLEDYFRFYSGLRPHRALGYRTPAEVFHGNQDAVEGDSNARRGSPDRRPNYRRESRDSHLTRPVSVQIMGSTSAHYPRITLPEGYALNQCQVKNLRSFSILREAAFLKEKMQ